MSDNNPDFMPIAVRVFPEPPEKEKQDFTPGKTWRSPESMFVFDTETRTAETQRLTFGSYRFIVKGDCLEEGLFHADDLPQDDREILERYVARHNSAMPNAAGPQLLLLARPAFLDKLFLAAYKGRCLLVGFNLPFDLSRLAVTFSKARGKICWRIFARALDVYRQQRLRTAK